MLPNFLAFAEVYFYIPVFELHGAVFLKVEMHLEGAIPHLRLVANLALETIGFGNVEILCQLVFIVRMGALLDDQTGALLRCHSAQVGKTLLGDHAVEVVLGVVDVRAVRHDAGDTVRISLGRT